MSKRILILEDEPALARVIQDYLIRDGFTAEVYHDGTDAVATILDTRPDLVVLDLMLPGKDGLTICREVRAATNLPIIFETARVEEIDRLLGLELGADDYICKPFSPRELVARVKAVLRRTDPKAEDGAPPRLIMDDATWIASIKGVSLDLTRREFQILHVMFNRPGRVFSRAQLLDLALPDDAAVIDRTIDSHIKNIRAKVKAVCADWDPIRSVYGVGYAFEL
ncbi:response regulator [Tabrizicola sp.]|uniref:response regulator n=1 Tax=Tabrizicola sp. TaxID=2005166 RepID=UPI003F3C053A